MEISDSTRTVIYALYVALNVQVLKELNTIVTEPYMDEPFHVPQVQAYCRGEWDVWDSKITTPPGLYLISVVLKKIFLLKCNLPMLRLVPVVFQAALPIILSFLSSFHKHDRPPLSLLAPTIDAIVISAFPISWFFSFLYYTDVPSLVFVVGTVAAATQGKHMLAGLLGLASCMFRQTNIIWVMYAFMYSQLTVLRHRRSDPKLRDPPASAASPSDIPKLLFSVPSVIPHLLHGSSPYILDCVVFTAFVVWNGGIVLGDKSNHVPALHVPQLYYFLGFATAFGWPALIGGPGGPAKLVSDVCERMFATKLRVVSSIILSIGIAVTVHFFTIHHPFVLSDNRHYVFYIWKRVFGFHPAAPYLLSPVYLACSWAWFIRAGTDQTLLQTIALPLCLIPTLLPTPLIEPRYFLIPYVLLRVQLNDVNQWMVAVEVLWYALINAATMYVFLYRERAGVGRFMW